MEAAVKKEWFVMWKKVVVAANRKCSWEKFRKRRRTSTREQPKAAKAHAKLFESHVIKSISTNSSVLPKINVSPLSLTQHEQSIAN